MMKGVYDMYSSIAAGAQPRTRSLVGVLSVADRRDAIMHPFFIQVERQRQMYKRAYGFDWICVRAVDFSNSKAKVAKWPWSSEFTIQWVGTVGKKAGVPGSAS